VAEISQQSSAETFREEGKTREPEQVQGEVFLVPCRGCDIREGVQVHGRVEHGSFSSFGLFLTTGDSGSPPSLYVD